MFIKTKIQINVPEFAIKNQQWQFPVANQQFNKCNAPLTSDYTAFIKVIENNLVEVEKKINLIRVENCLLINPLEDYSSLIAIDLLGNSYLSISDKRNNRIDEIFEKLPALWEWAKDTIDKQDEMIEEIENKLEIRLNLNEKHRENFGYQEYNRILFLYEKHLTLLQNYPFQSKIFYKYTSLIEILEKIDKDPDQYIRDSITNNKDRYWNEKAQREKEKQHHLNIIEKLRNKYNFLFE